MLSGINQKEKDNRNENKRERVEDFNFDLDESINLPNRIIIFPEECNDEISALI